MIKKQLSLLKNNCKLVYQENKGYGDALICGINQVKTNFFVFLMLTGHLIL